MYLYIPIAWLTMFYVKCKTIKSLTTVGIWTESKWCDMLIMVQVIENFASILPYLKAPSLIICESWEKNCCYMYITLNVILFLLTCLNTITNCFKVQVSEYRIIFEIMRVILLLFFIIRKFKKLTFINIVSTISRLVTLLWLWRMISLF